MIDPELRQGRIVKYAMKGNRPWIYAAVSEYGTEIEDLFYPTMLRSKLVQANQRVAAGSITSHVRKLLTFNMIENVPGAEVYDILAPEHPKVEWAPRRKWLRRVEHEAWTVLTPVLEAGGFLPVIEQVEPVATPLTHDLPPECYWG